MGTKKVGGFLQPAQESHCNNESSDIRSQGKSFSETRRSYI
jgi:hypothetical protein